MRRIIWGVAAAVLVGVMVGLISRLGMALLAIAAGDASHFTAGGTASILMIYTVAMLPGAVGAAFIRGWARWLLPAVGGVFLLLPAIGVASEEVGDVSGLSSVRMLLVGIISLSVFATIPATAILTVRAVDRMGKADAGNADAQVGISPEQPVDARA